MMDLANGLFGLGRHLVYERLDGSHEIGVQSSDEIVVILFLACLGKRVPRQLVKVPSVFHLYVGKA